MRFLSALALLLTAAVLPAQDFDFKGVPADYAVTFATASSRGLKIGDSPQAKAFKARLEKLVAGIDKSGQDSKAMQAAIVKATGLDLESPDNRYAGGFSMTKDGSFTGGLIVRARHDSAKLAAHAKAKNVPSLQAGAAKGWKIKELIASLSDELAQAANSFPTPPGEAGSATEEFGVFDVDNDTMVIAQPKEAARIIGLFKGQGSSYALPAAQRSAVAGPPNFLIIAVDDLNDYIGPFGGHPNASTPHFDRLAERGVFFTRAYCNSPVCNPSRASIWTGLRPTTTGITSNQMGWFRDVPGFEKIMTLPQALAARGYSTMGFGKLFHPGRGTGGAGEWQRFNLYDYGPRQDPKLNYPMGDKITDWGVPDGNNEYAASYDRAIADRVIDALNDSYSQSFLLGCGFYRPHTPLYAAQKWFDLHPRDGLAIPPGYKKDDTDDLVYFGKRPRRPQDIEAPGLFTQEWAEETGKWKDVLQAYLASISAMDHQLGRVIDALDASKHRDNMIVILFSDHGWHLGEKRHWGKAALWEQTTRVPFFIMGPGLPKGVRCEKPVDLLNIYPTVVDYAGVPPPHALAGHSLRPLLEKADAPWPHAVVTTFVDHHALRTPTHRYIRYASGEEELYDHRADPHEWENLAVTRGADPATKERLSELRRQLESVLQK